MQTAAAEKDPAKFSGKKSKAAAKKGAGSTQWDILIRSGIPEAEVPRFRCRGAFACAVSVKIYSSSSALRMACLLPSTNSFAIASHDSSTAAGRK